MFMNIVAEAFLRVSSAANNKVLQAPKEFCEEKQCSGDNKRLDKPLLWK